MTRTAPDSSVPAQSHSLRADALGVGAITFFVVSAAGPLVAMAGGLPVSMLLGNGAGIPAAFLAALLVLLIFAVGYTALATVIRGAGGFYTFAAAAMGGYAAGATGAVALLSYGTMQLGIYGLFGAATAAALSHVGAGAIPWWVCSLSALAVIGALGYRNVDLSAKVLGVLVLAEYVVVLVLDIAIVLSSRSDLSAAAFSPSVIASGSPWIGLMMCFSAFIGFEATTIYGEEARDPARTIPRATYISLLLIGGFYVFSSWCVVAGVGSRQLLPVLQQMTDPTELIFRLSDQYVGGALTSLMRLLFITSSFAALLAFHNSLARYFFALGREGLLPQALSRTHPTTRSPYIGSLVQTVVALVTILPFVLGGADPVTTLFARLSALGTVGIIALMAMASVAVWTFFRRSSAPAWKVKVLPAVSAAALIAIFLLTWRHFDTLAGGGDAVVAWLPTAIIVAAILGIGLAARLRRRDAEKFRRLGCSAAL